MLSCFQLKELSDHLTDQIVEVDESETDEVKLLTSLLRVYSKVVREIPIYEYTFLPVFLGSSMKSYKNVVII